MDSDDPYEQHIACKLNSDGIGVLSLSYISYIVLLACFGMLVLELGGDQYTHSSWIRLFILDLVLGCKSKDIDSLFHLFRRELAYLYQEIVNDLLTFLSLSSYLLIFQPVDQKNEFVKWLV